MQERTLHDFFNDFEGLMQIHRENLAKGYRILPTIRNFSAEDAETIVNGIKTGNVASLNRIRKLESYLAKVLDDFDMRTSDSRHWEYYYPYNEDDVDLYSIELHMIFVLRRLLGDLRNQVSSFFEVMRPTEMMALQSISRQKRIPEAIVEYEIGKYLGKKPVGGKTKKKVRRNRKTKRTRK